MGNRVTRPTVTVDGKLWYKSSKQRSNFSWMSTKWGPKLNLRMTIISTKKILRSFLVSKKMTDPRKSCNETSKYWTISAKVRSSLKILLVSNYSNLSRLLFDIERIICQAHQSRQLERASIQRKNAEGSLLEPVDWKVPEKTFQFVFSSWLDFAFIWRAANFRKTWWIHQQNKILRTNDVTQFKR